MSEANIHCMAWHAAGGSVRTVLELAGIQNGFGKQIGSPNPLNNARCTIECLSQMRSMQEIADTRGMSIKEMLTYQGGKQLMAPCPPVFCLLMQLCHCLL